MTFNQARRRVLSAASFDPDTYDSLRDDPTATSYAYAVVVGATLLSALGGLLWTLFAASPPQIYKVATTHFLLRSVLLGSLIQIAMWLVWVLFTVFFLRSLYLLRDVDPRRLIRTMGFAFAPMALQLFIFIPVLDFPIGIIAIGATFGCTVLAVRAASGATPGQALISTLAGFALFVLVMGMLGTSDVDLAPGIFALDPNSLSIALELDLEAGR